MLLKKKTLKKNIFHTQKKYIYWTFDHDQIGETCGKKKKTYKRTCNMFLKLYNMQKLCFVCLGTRRIIKIENHAFSSKEIPQEHYFFAKNIRTIRSRSDGWQLTGQTNNLDNDNTQYYAAHNLLHVWRHSVRNKKLQKETKICNWTFGLSWK